MLSPFRSTALTRPWRQGWNDDFFSDTFDPLNTQQIMNNFMEQAIKMPFATLGNTAAYCFFPTPLSKISMKCYPLTALGMN